MSLLKANAKNSPLKPGQAPDSRKATENDSFGGSTIKTKNMSKFEVIMTGSSNKDLSSVQHLAVTNVHKQQSVSSSEINKDLPQSNFDTLNIHSVLPMPTKLSEEASMKELSKITSNEESIFKNNPGYLHKSSTEQQLTTEENNSYIDKRDSFPIAKYNYQQEYGLIQNHPDLVDCQKQIENIRKKKEQGWFKPVLGKPPAALMKPTNEQVATGVTPRELLAPQESIMSQIPLHEAPSSSSVQKNSSSMMIDDPNAGTMYKNPMEGTTRRIKPSEEHLHEANITSTQVDILNKNSFTSQDVANLAPTLPMVKQVSPTSHGHSQLLPKQPPPFVARHPNLQVSGNRVPSKKQSTLPSMKGSSQDRVSSLQQKTLQGFRSRNKGLAGNFQTEVAKKSESVVNLSTLKRDSSKAASKKGQWENNKISSKIADLAHLMAAKQDSEKRLIQQFSTQVSTKQKKIPQLRQESEPAQSEQGNHIILVPLSQFGKISSAFVPQSRDETRSQEVRIPGVDLKEEHDQMKVYADSKMKPGERKEVFRISHDKDKPSETYKHQPSMQVTTMQHNSVIPSTVGDYAVDINSSPGAASHRKKAGDEEEVSQIQQPLVSKVEIVKPPSKEAEPSGSVSSLIPLMLIDPNRGSSGDPQIASAHDTTTLRRNDQSWENLASRKSEQLVKKSLIKNQNLLPLNQPQRGSYDDAEKMKETHPYFGRTDMPYPVNSQNMKDISDEDLKEMLQIAENISQSEKQDEADQQATKTQSQQYFFNQYSAPDLAAINQQRAATSQMKVKKPQSQFNHLTVQSPEKGFSLKQSNSADRTSIVSSTFKKIHPPVYAVPEPAIINQEATNEEKPSFLEGSLAKAAESGLIQFAAFIPKTSETIEAASTTKQFTNQSFFEVFNQSARPSSQARLVDLGSIQASLGSTQYLFAPIVGNGAKLGRLIKPAETSLREGYKNVKPLGSRNEKLRSYQKYKLETEKLANSMKSPCGSMMKLHSKLGSEKQKRETSQYWKEKQTLEGQKLNPLMKKYSQERVLRALFKLQDENQGLKKTIYRLEKKIRIQSKHFKNTASPASPRIMGHHHSEMANHDLAAPAGQASARDLKARMGTMDPSAIDANRSGLNGKSQEQSVMLETQITLFDKRSGFNERSYQKGGAATPSTLIPPSSMRGEPPQQQVEAQDQSAMDVFMTRQSRRISELENEVAELKHQLERYRRESTNQKSTIKRYRDIVNTNLGALDSPTKKALLLDDASKRHLLVPNNQSTSSQEIHQKSFITDQELRFSFKERANKEMSLEKLVPPAIESHTISPRKQKSNVLSPTDQDYTDYLLDQNTVPKAREQEKSSKKKLRENSQANLRYQKKVEGSAKHTNEMSVTENFQSGGLEFEQVQKEASIQRKASDVRPRRGNLHIVENQNHPTIDEKSDQRTSEDNYFVAASKFDEASQFLRGGRLDPTSRTKGLLSDINISQKTGKTKKSGGSHLSQQFKVYDYQRMERLQNVLQAINKADNLGDILEAILSSVKGIVNCSMGCFFCLEANLFSKKDQRHLTIQKTIVESRYLDVVGLSELDIQNPSFGSLHDAQNPVYTHRFISQPIFDSEGRLILTFQIESKFRLKKMAPGQQDNLHHDSVMENGVMKSKQHLGFSLIDEQVMCLISQAVRMKLDQLLSMRKMISMQQEVIHTIELAGAICTQRTQSDLVQNIKLTLPHFFGFEGATVLLRDVKTDFLFTINELSKDETEQYLREQFRLKDQERKEKKTIEKEQMKAEKRRQALYEDNEKVRDSSETSRASVTSSDSKMNEEEQKYVESIIHKFRETKKITFPNDRGISGRVFQDQKTIFANEMHREVNFSSDIDNLTGVKDVRNFMIGPVFAHKTDVKDDNSPLEFDRSKPIGVVQLINKKDFAAISEYDVQKFNSLQNLIGLSIDLTTETHSVINIRIGMQEGLTRMDALLNEGGARYM